VTRLERGRTLSICALLALAACESADERSWPPDDETCESADERSWLPYDETYAFEGKMLDQWVVEWARWEYANTTCDAPDVDEDGFQCGLYQQPDSPVFFFAGGTALTTRTKCVVPAQRALVVPLFAYMTDNTGVPEDSPWSAAELASHAEAVMSTMTDMRLVADGIEIADPPRFAVGPLQYSYEVPPEPNWYSCNDQPGITGTIDPAVVAGYFAVMPPPTPGVHELEYSGVGRAYSDNTWTGEQLPFSNHVKTTFVVDAR
jgi:hypothetical protein